MSQTINFPQNDITFLSHDRRSSFSVMNDVFFRFWLLFDRLYLAFRSDCHIDCCSNPHFINPTEGSSLVKQMRTYLPTEFFCSKVVHPQTHERSALEFSQFLHLLSTHFKFYGRKLSELWLFTQLVNLSTLPVPPERSMDAF